MALGFRVNSHVPSSFTAEALTVLRGLQFTRELGFNSVLLESDSKTIITKLKSRERDYLEVDLITCDTKLLATNFESCSFSFVGQNGNKPKHALAAADVGQTHDRFWIEEAPTQFRSHSRFFSFSPSTFNDK
ncbi:hypothetical protein GQ457_16G020360 [Hibiscus cannabinus]